MDFDFHYKAFVLFIIFYFSDYNYIISPLPFFHRNILLTENYFYMRRTTEPKIEEDTFLYFVHFFLLYLILNFSKCSINTSDHYRDR